MENIDPRYPTVVVHFLEYGNSEEVSLSDVRPDPQVLGYTTYSVSLQPDPQFVEGPTLYMYPLHV